MPAICYRLKVWGRILDAEMVEIDEIQRNGMRKVLHISN